MTSLAARVRSGLQATGLVARGDRVVAALSGGPDSVALTVILHEVLPSLGATLAGVAHLHHGLRGADADLDERSCRDLAQRLDLRVVADQVDVAAVKRERRISLEAAGRAARYAFYERARTQLGATLVATGHTRDDLAETFLMRAARGAGLRGLGGIRPRVGCIVRPLLDVSRAELLADLAERGQPFREDATNRDTRLTRNRVRHDVLPWLERQLGPGVSAALARAARLAAADDEYLAGAATKAGGSVVSTEEGTVRLDCAAALDLPLALRRRVVLAALEELGGRAARLTDVERVLDLLADGSEDLADHLCRGVATARVEVRLPRVRVTREPGRLVLIREPARRSGGPRQMSVGQPPAVLLPVPGAVELPSGGAVVATIAAELPGRGVAGGPDEAALDAGRVPVPLAVRFRRPGDRLRPLGMAGRKKLQDVLVDRKVPREIRDSVPLVVDAADRIVWVAGHVVAEDARVTPATTSVLLLQYRRSC
jgi:tRNA(Ile)-lysidine synthase